MTLKGSKQSKSIFFTKHDLFYREYGTDLNKAEMKYVDNKCQAATKKHNSNYLGQFFLDDLVVGDDISIHKDLPCERFCNTHIDA